MLDTHSGGLTQADLVQWSTELIVRAGLNRPGDFCLVVWGHDSECALHPSRQPWWTSSSRCRCEPDATVIVNLGASDERRVGLLRDGQLLPVRRPAGRNGD
jgi:hypothetical protein